MFKIVMLKTQFAVNCSQITDDGYKELARRLIHASVNAMDMVANEETRNMGAIVLSNTEVES